MVGLDLDAIQESFESNGYAVIDSIIPPDIVPIYIDLVQRMRDGEIDASSHRHDLGGHKEEQVAGKENVGQIMWPSDLVEHSREGPLHQRAYAITKLLMGEGTAFDFDMLIYKDPYTKTETPWHQDEACKLTKTCLVAVSHAESACVCVPCCRRLAGRDDR